MSVPKWFMVLWEHYVGLDPYRLGTEVRHTFWRAMSEIFITADEHYGHENIIKYCKRPFANVSEMRDHLISQHNAKVPDNRNMLTIHVGDMFWHTVPLKEALDILYALNGRHAFIYGNHDELIEQQLYLRQQFDWVRGENKASGTYIVKFDKMEIFVCHYAMRVWNGSHKGSCSVYGHSHNELPVVGKSFDIGVDGHSPWSLEEIVAVMKTRPNPQEITKENLWPGKKLGKSNE